MASDALLARVAAYPTGGVLSRLGRRRLPGQRARSCARWRAGTREVALVPASLSIAARWRGTATLLFHRHDERLEGLAQLVLKGAIEERPDRRHCSRWSTS